MTSPNTNGGQSIALVGTIGNQAVASHETSSSAVAAQAKALVEARFVMAMHRPRNMNDVRVRILDTCKRPGFAALALYGIERNNNRTNQKVMITGPSIRFAEEAARAMGNILIDPMVTYDDDEKRVVKVMVTDLESNLSWPTDVVVTKTIERSKVFSNQKVLRSRQNSDGNMVYIVAGTDDDIAFKQNSAVSKAARNGILRLLPGDILEDAIEQIRATQRAEDKRDPKAALKKLVDAYASIGIAPSQIEAYLGHPLEQLSDAERDELRGIYAAIKEGQTTWAEATVRETAPASKSEAATPPPAAPTSRGTEGLRSRVAARKTAAPAEPKPEPKPAAPRADDRELTEEEILALDDQRRVQEQDGAAASDRDDDENPFG